MITSFKVNGETLQVPEHTFAASYRLTIPEIIGNVVDKKKCFEYLEMHAEQARIIETNIHPRGLFCGVKGFRPSQGEGPLHAQATFFPLDIAYALFRDDSETTSVDLQKKYFVNIQETLEIHNINELITPHGVRQLSKLKDLTIQQCYLERPFALCYRLSNPQSNTDKKPIPIGVLFPASQNIVDLFIEREQHMPTY